MIGGSIEYDIFIGAKCKNQQLSEKKQPIDKELVEKHMPKGYGLFNSVYLSSMPGIAQDGTFVPSTRGDYYCDSIGYGNGDPVCQEIDVMEASYFEYRATVHTCNAPTSTGWINECDMDGCNKYVEHEYTNETFGWGSEYQINTEQPFHTKMDFEAADDGSIASVTTTITQGEKFVVLPLGNKYCNSLANDYLKGIEASLNNGMVFIASNWGNL